MVDNFNDLLLESFFPFPRVDSEGEAFDGGGLVCILSLFVSFVTFVSFVSFVSFVRSVLFFIDGGAVFTFVVFLTCCLEIENKFRESCKELFRLAFFCSCGGGFGGTGGRLTTLFNLELFFP